ncbi:MAG TPA: hypothetical protein VEO53_01320, partial [Candidatus Binatia bacterium]|nr:hypothetical protein [Candidatus Binatia bacterium]
PAIESALLNAAGGQRAAVWDWLKTQPDNETTKLLRNEVLSSAAWQDPELALRLVADLPRTAEGDGKVQELARLLFNGGRALHRFDKLFGQVPDRLRQALVEEAFNYLSADSLGDPQRWAARLSLLPEASRAKGLESIARAWATQTPEEAIDWVESLPPGAARNGGVAAIASTWAAKDARGAAEWVGAMASGAERDRGAESLVMAIAERFPREAWDWALSIDDPAERTRAASHTVKMMAARDPATARQWIETGPFTPETRAELQSALAGSSQMTAQ